MRRDNLFAIQPLSRGHSQNAAYRQSSLFQAYSLTLDRLADAFDPQGSEYLALGLEESVVDRCQLVTFSIFSQAFVEFFLVETNHLIPNAMDESLAPRTKHPLHSRCRYRFVKEQNRASDA